jgi:OHCU decarboxylase
MRLDDLNALDRAAAEDALLRCCGSERWAREMAAGRPWPNLEAMAAEADKIWRGLAIADRLQAFAAHPRIGQSGGERWSSQEQSGVMAAGDDVRERLAAANDDYHARFGFLFIVCATGKSAEEMLAILNQRLTHSPEEELQVASEEQRKITRLRLEKLLAWTHDDDQR